MADGENVTVQVGGPKQPGSHGAEGGHLLTRLGRHNDILIVGGVLLASVVGGYMISKILSKKYGEKIGLSVKDPVSDPTLGQPDMGVSLEGDMIPGQPGMTEVPNILNQREKPYQLQSGQRIDLTDIDYYDLLREKINNPGTSPRPFGYGDRVVNNSPYYSPYAGGSPYFIPGGYYNPFAFNARRMSEEDTETDEYIDDETASMIASDRSLEDAYGIVNSRNADEAEADEMMTGEHDSMFMTPEEVDMYEDGRIETASPIMPIKYSSVRKGGGWNNMVDDRFNSMVIRDENGTLIGLRGGGGKKRKGKRRRMQLNY